MINIFRYNKKWRIRIVDETLECKHTKDFVETLEKVLNLKLDKEPYK